jgi:uncharacterized protein DUF4330
MALIDNEGRLFGRINLIDAAAVLVVVILVPVAYTALALFRTPAPQIASIDPVPVVQAPEMRVKLRGLGLRPLLTAYIGDRQANAYLYENDQSVDVLFGGAGPGKYDLVLLDGVQEVLRARSAIVVVAPAVPDETVVRVAGVVVGLNEKRAAGLAVGQKAEAAGHAVMEVLEVGRPRPDYRFLNAGDTSVALPLTDLRQVPVVLRLRCTLSGSTCSVEGGLLESRKIVSVPHPDGALHLLVDAILPDEALKMADVTVRFLLDRETAALMKPGHRDTSVSGMGPSAEIASVDPVEVTAGEVSRLSDVGGDRIERRIPERVATVTAVLRLQVNESPYGQFYRSHMVRVGSGLIFTGPGYQVSGTVIGVRWHTAAGGQ